MIVLPTVPIDVSGRPNDSGIGLPGELVERRLGIEKIDVARPAFHEQKDDRLGAWRMMRSFRSQWIRRRRPRSRESASAFSMSSQSDCAQAASGSRQEPPPRRDCGLRTGKRIHWSSATPDKDQPTPRHRSRLTPSTFGSASRKRLALRVPARRATSRCRKKNVRIRSFSHPSGVREYASRKASAACRDGSAPARSNTRPANACAHSSDSCEFSIVSAWGAVVVCVRREQLSCESGISKALNIG